MIKPFAQPYVALPPFHFAACVLKMYTKEVPYFILDKFNQGTHKLQHSVYRHPSMMHALSLRVCMPLSCLQSSTVPHPHFGPSWAGTTTRKPASMNGFQFQRTACCVRPSSPWAGMGEVVSHIWTGSSWPGAPSFHGEQETLAGRSFTALFIFGVDYMSTIMEYNSRLHIR